jgi:putative membrane protein
MNRRILFATAAFALLSPVGIAFAQDANQTTDAMTMEVTSAEQFIMMAAMGDRFEIESSELALENAKSEDVKEFAQQMIADHTANTKNLMQTVEGNGGEMTAPKSLDEQHQAMMDKLKAASDDNFDAAYIDAQVMSHQQSVALFSSYAENGDNETLKAFAQKQLPIIQMHYEHVQKMDASM